MKTTAQQEQFEALVQTHQDKIYRICYGYCAQAADVQDVYQEVLIKIWRYLPSFKGESKITTWLFRIAVNTCLSYISSEQKRKAQFAPLQTQIAQVASKSNEAQQQQSEQLEHLRWCISQLPNMDRSLVLLSLEGMSYDEMTDITGLTSSNIGVRLHRAKAKLKQMML